MIRGFATSVRCISNREWATLAVALYFATFWGPRFWNPALPLLVLCSSVALLRKPLLDPNAIHAVGYLQILAFVVASTVSSVTGVHPVASFAISTALIPSVVVYCVITFYLRGAKDLSAIRFALLAMVMAISICIIGTATIGRVAEPRRIVDAVSSAILVVPNDVVILSVLAPIALIRSSRVGWHGTATALCATSVVVVTSVLLRSRTSLIALLIGLFVPCMLSNRRGHHLSALVLVVISASSVLTDWMGGFTLLSKSWDTLKIRMSLWEMAWRMFGEATIWGQGPGSFAFANLSDPASNASNGSRDEIDEFVPWPHCLYLEILAERGSVGLVTFALVTMRAMFLAIWIARSSIASLRQYGAALAGMLAAFCAAALFELTFLHLWVVVVWMLLAALVECTAASCRLLCKREGQPP